MSEYQYYEFQALDRPLTPLEQLELRACSSRATITATHFVNHYNWGDFKGNPSTWMEKYFDAFLYLANWGTHELRIRLPHQALDHDTAKQYCCGRAASVRSKNGFVILEFLSEEESDWEEDWDDGTGWLSSLIPLRADLAGGDHRVLYLAWLLCVQAGKLKDDAVEPPVPPGLGDLTGPLQAFADFLRINEDLIQAAATRSPTEEASSSSQEIKKWIAALPDSEKTGWLVRLAEGGEPHLRAELLQRFRKSRPDKPKSKGGAPRTVEKLLAAAERIAEARHREEAARAAEERTRRQREEAEARRRYLTELAQRETRVWRQIDELIATKQPGRYDEAVKLLCDLRDLGVQEGRAREVEARISRLREEHARKPSFLERLKKAGLG